RRLFPADRVAKESDSQQKEERLDAQAVAVVGKQSPGDKPEEKKEDGGIALKKNGDGRELETPVRDRVDPDRLKTILTAIPDIWAEEFVQKPKPDLGEYGLKDPAQTLRITLRGGRTVTLHVGKTSQTKTRTEMKPSPPGLPVPAQREVVHD